MPRYKLTVEYDGTGLAGWQRQDNFPSVQQYLEEAIAAYCRQQVTLQCAGRTDAGVHALGQVAHVDLPEERKPYSIQQGINFHLLSMQMPQISVLKAEPVSPDFHARFDAKKRHYLYRIINRSAPLAVERNRAWVFPDRLDIAQMQQGAHAVLMGRHDFSSFRDSHCQAKSPIKTLDRLDIRQDGELIEIRLEAQSFLHHQVRIMVGSLRLVGNGKWSIADLQAARDAKNRRAAGPTAPPEGLFLVKVDY